jgi:serine/threonine-protein kinase
MASDAPPPSLPSDFFAADLELAAPANELDVLPVGFNLGSYVVRGCIGHGAMASVYRAEHSLLKKPVALKLMKTTLLKSTEARQRFFREARAAAAIKHPNVANITDMGTANGVPYLVMELLEGVDLEKHLEQRGALPEHEVIALALPLIAALGVAHDTGVVHRDLKPANIFLAREAGGEIVPKVLDFGISKFSEAVATDDWTATGLDQLMGSPLYVPPEAVQGARQLTARSDQYSLGVVLYECVTGKPPFERESLIQLLTAITEGQFAAPSYLRPDVSVALERAILRAMSLQPEQRFADMRDLGRALLDLADPRTLALWAGAFDYEPQTTRSLYRTSPARAVESLFGEVTPSAPVSSGTTTTASTAAATPAAPDAAELELDAAELEVDAAELGAGAAEPTPDAERLAHPPEPARKRRTWPMLALGLTGVALLWFSASQLRSKADPSQLPHAPVSSESRALEPVRASESSPASARASVPPLELRPVVPEAAVPKAAVPTADSATTIKRSGDVSRGDVIAVRDVTPASTEAPAARRATRVRRSTRTESNAELREMFAPRRSVQERVSSSPPPAEAIGVANEAPIFD